MKAVLLSTNIGNFNTTVLKQIAKTVLKIDLSSKIKDRLEGIRVLSRMITPDAREDNAIIYSCPILGHVWFTFAITIEDILIAETIEMFDGFKCTLVNETNNPPLWIVSGTLDQWLNFIFFFEGDKIKTILENEGLTQLFK